ncbi:MAG: hypothetical protein QMD66_01695 [Actinomycetota bacterium]|nr:hypothetical protein [Actinomycetota bacterium]MDI6821581.1 hypothetical protein [Actinomycetota bacterium]
MAVRYLLILLGVVLLVLGVYGIASFWWDELYILIKGGVGLLLLIAGLISLISGISDLRQ